MASHWRYCGVQIQSEKQFKIESALDYLDYLIWIISGNFPWFQANFSNSAKKTFRPYLLNKLNQPWNGLQYIKPNAKDVYYCFSLTCVIKSCPLGPVTRIKIIWSQVQPFPLLALAWGQFGSIWTHTSWSDGEDSTGQPSPLQTTACEHGLSQLFTWGLFLACQLD